ncbi:hypothetical protein C461_09118 [Halorubrum aidingense JCM 13560]|uniref:Uncharacterized protein n=1 Tax=Halorubrum aidingense JCM 13560 TaxID=1230454 RepID=M0PBH6_9EURY|nr:hypothetical protein C461_09118 [Halorubrum aidingense JCM 13560]
MAPWSCLSTTTLRSWFENVSYTKSAQPDAPEAAASNSPFQASYEPKSSAMRSASAERPAGRAGGRRLELALPGLVRAEVLRDAVRERPLGLVAALRAHVLPEQVVEDVSRRVVRHVPDRARRRGEVALLAVGFERLFGRVPAVHVALMVGVVMPFEHLLGDVRLQRVVIVRQRIEFVAHR